MHDSLTVRGLAPIAQANLRVSPARLDGGAALRDSIAGQLGMIGERGSPVLQGRIHVACCIAELQGTRGTLRREEC